MTMEHMQKDQEEQVPHLLVPLPGRKGPGGGNWLIDLEIGTIFLSKPVIAKGERPNPFLEQWHIIGGEVGERYRFLMTNLNSVMYSWTDTVVFCETRDLVKYWKGAVDGSDDPLPQG